MSLNLAFLFGGVSLIVVVAMCVLVLGTISGRDE